MPEDRADKGVMALSSVIAILLLIPSIAWAGNSKDPCASPVDLRAPGMSMESVPVLDQDGLGLCFAYAASQMADAYVHSHPQAEKDASQDPKFQTSPIAAALEYSEHHFVSRNFYNPITTGGGDTCNITNQIRKGGACDGNFVYGSYLAQSNMLKALHAFDQYKDAESRLAIFERQLRDGDSGKSQDELEQEASELQEKEGVAFAGACDLMEKSFWPNGLQDSVEAIKRFIDQSNSVKLVRETVLASCDLPEHREKPELPACRTKLTFEKHSVYGKINRLLSRPNPQPVGIGYCAQVLTKGPHAWLWSKLHVTKCDGHESLVIGRREVGGKCQFLVRNSWGTDCGGYASNWECEKGNIWIDADVLETAVYEISTLDGSGL